MTDAHEQPKPKKSLGQNFLTSRAIAAAIVDTARLEHTDTVLEIGPGAGILTRELLRSAGKVIAVEKDPRMITLLTGAFAEDFGAGTLKLMEADALDVPLQSLGLSAASYALVANIPYYVTGAILRRFLSDPVHPSHAVLLVQKEVAERIVRDPKESILSISVKAYGTPTYVRTVARSYFAPQPNVDSAVLMISGISKSRFNGVPEERFFAFVRAGFAQKRKFLASNLKSVADTSQIAAAFKAVSLAPTVRAEELSIEAWFGLARALT